MTYLGHCENGVIKLDGGVAIAEGTRVRVEVLPSSDGDEKPEPAPRTLAERYKSIIGKAKGLPADSAAEHDHYLYGTPKKAGDDPSGEGSSDFEHYKSIIGVIKDLPSDFAAQHDHYIHGTPKR